MKAVIFKKSNKRYNRSSYGCSTYHASRRTCCSGTGMRQPRDDDRWNAPTSDLDDLWTGPSRDTSSMHPKSSDYGVQPSETTDRVATLTLSVRSVSVGALLTALSLAAQSSTETTHSWRVPSLAAYAMMARKVRSVLSDATAEGFQAPPAKATSSLHRSCPSTSAGMDNNRARSCFMVTHGGWRS